MSKGAWLSMDKALHAGPSPALVCFLPRPRPLPTGAEASAAGAGDPGIGQTSAANRTGVTRFLTVLHLAVLGVNTGNQPSAGQCVSCPSWFSPAEQPLPGSSEIVAQEGG